MTLPQDLRDKLSSALSYTSVGEDCFVIADAIAPLIAEALADAWDAGWSAAAGYYGGFEDDPEPDNPYRRAAVATTTETPAEPIHPLHKSKAGAPCFRCGQELPQDFLAASHEDWVTCRYWHDQMDEWAVQRADDA